MTATLASRRLTGLLLALAALCLAGLPAHAQAESAASGPDSNVYVAVTYAGSFSNHTDGNRFFLNGGAVQLHAPFHKGLAVEAAATGLHSGGSTSTVAPLDLVILAFGPSYTIHPRPRLAIFGEVLFGEADGFHSTFSYASGPSNDPNYGIDVSASSLALQAGGGADLHLKHRLGIRAVQVDYLRTQLPNGITNVQNNIRVAAGLTFRLGK